MTVITLASIIGFSDTEKGVSTGAASWGLKVAVRMKNVSSNVNRSTIGVMSIRGDLCPNLIFGILSILSFCYQKNKFGKLFPY